MRGEKALFSFGSRDVRVFAFASLMAAIFCRGGSAADAPFLALVTSTRTQIVLQWMAPESGEPIGYQLQRSLTEDFSTATTLSLPPAPAIYSDTGFDPDYARRFSTTNLEFGVPYHYRMRAQYESSWSDYSNIISAWLQYPVRGESGDFFADVVLGQPDFFQNSPGETIPTQMHTGSAILIDNGATPERAYFTDTNHSRILGFSNIHARPLIPDIVIGQPDFYHSAPNGEATLQGYPDSASPSASTLALSRPNNLSIGETVLRNQLAVDATGNLYVPDVCNHRVLKYEDPFTTDSIADEVWGQPGFTTREENYGGISNSSIRFKLAHTFGSVTIGPSGSLWVADSGNFRVLRFPYDSVSGEISKWADLVLGQPDFTTGTAPDPPLRPFAIQITDDGTVYVAEATQETQIAVYEPPLSNGMARTRIFASTPTVPVVPTCLFLDPLGRGIWIQGNTSSTSWTRLLDLSDASILIDIVGPQAKSMGVDGSGNLYLLYARQGVYEYPPPYDEADRTLIMVDSMIYSGRHFQAARGCSIFGDQLAVTDRERHLIWNDGFPVETYEHADDLWGQADFDVHSTYPQVNLSCPTVDAQNRLWMSGRFRIDGSFYFRFRAFAYPLTHDSEPVKDLSNTFDLVDATGSITTCIPIEWFCIELADGGDQMWIADILNHRVLRVNNIDGENDSGRGPYVDVVLGQPDCTSTEPNQGGDIGPDTLKRVRFVSLDGEGNVYVADNGGEGGTNRRILIFDRDLFPDDLDHVVYAPDATKVLGTGGDFTIRGCVDETCDPCDMAFDPQSGAMVCAMGLYNPNGEHFPLVYVDPTTFDRPQFALGDFTASSKNIHVDESGNVYIADIGWSRIMIYWQPFRCLSQVYTGLQGEMWLAY